MLILSQKAYQLISQFLKRGKAKKFLEGFSCRHVNFVFKMFFVIVLTLNNLAVCLLSLSYSYSSTLPALLIFILYLFDQVLFLYFNLSMAILIAQTHLQFFIYIVRFRAYVMLWPCKTSSSNQMSISWSLCNATPGFSSDLLSLH